MTPSLARNEPSPPTASTSSSAEITPSSAAEIASPSSATASASRRGFETGGDALSSCSFL
jgi:hypothetical protein